MINYALFGRKYRVEALLCQVESFQSSINDVVT